MNELDDNENWLYFDDVEGNVRSFTAADGTVTYHMDEDDLERALSLFAAIFDGEDDDFDAAIAPCGCPSCGSGHTYDWTRGSDAVESAICDVEDRFGDLEGWHFTCMFDAPVFGERAVDFVTTWIIDDAQEAVTDQAADWMGVIDAERQFDPERSFLISSVRDHVPSWRTW